MNLKVRTTKTSSKNTAVQVVHYANRKVNVIKHIGTAIDENGIRILKQQAFAWIQEGQNQRPLFREKLVDENKIFDYQYIFKKVQLTFAYEVLQNILKKFNFDLHLNNLLQNLVIAQILENGSKRHLVRFLEEQMNIDSCLRMVSTTKKQSKRFNFKRSNQSG